MRQFVATFTHEFPGHHILGSVRRTPAGMRRRFEHLSTIFPDLRFEVQHVYAQGWPRIRPPFGWLSLNNAAVSQTSIIGTDATSPSGTFRYAWVTSHKPSLIQSVTV